MLAIAQNVCFSSDDSENEKAQERAREREDNGIYITKVLEIEYF